PSDAAALWMRIGALEMKRFRIDEADEALQQSLEIDPGQSGALRLRAQLVGVLGRSRELTQCLVQLIRHQAFQLDDLVVLVGHAPFIPDPERLAATRQPRADETLPLLAQARDELNADRAVSAEQLLQKLVAAEPARWEAQALLGEIYSDRPGGE